VVVINGRRLLIYERSAALRSR